MTQFAGSFEPFLTRRDLDIVPHCPPRFFGYSDFRNQLTPTAQTYARVGGLELYFFGSWLLSLAFIQFVKNHSMERYRLEVLEPLKQDPKIGPRWHQARFADILP